jgi:SAM-dependent methyltransferase
MSCIFAGSGRGAQAPDGCSVELYRELPYFGELDVVGDFLPAGASVLELGCGTGRLTQVLLDRGLAPTCVDNSPEMLAHLPEGARAIHADIGSLALSENFDVVLLASCLVNHPDEKIRRAFLGCAARHAHGASSVLVQRHDPDWLLTAAVGSESSVGRVGVRVEAVQRKESLVAMTLAYGVGEETWRHHFVAAPLSDEQLDSLLAREGLQVIAWRGARRLWTIARPISPA